MPFWIAKIDRAAINKQNATGIIEATDPTAVEKILKRRMKPGEKVDVIYKTDFMVLEEGKIR